MTEARHLPPCPPVEDDYLNSLATDSPPPLDATAALLVAREQFLAGQEQAVPEQCQSHQEPRTFNLLSASDILALKRPSWRVKGMFPSLGLAAVFGQPGSAKTFVALDMAFAIGEGMDWFDMHTEACTVVYVNLESCGGLQKRLAAWQLDRQRPVSDSVRFVIEPFRILEDVDALACGLPIGAVVFLDTLNAAAAGMDENSSRDMGLILEAAKKLQRLTGGLVVLVHHCGKDGAKGLRGHSSLLAALDCAVEVSRNGEARYWRITKSKESEDGKRRGFRLKSVGIGYGEDGEPETSCVVEPDNTVQEEEKPLTPALKYALESLTSVLADKGLQSVHLDDWRIVFYAGHTADKVDTKKKSFNRARGELLALNKISVTNDYYSVFIEGQTGQKRDNSGTCPAPHIQKETGQTGQHPLGCVPMSRCPDGGPSYE